MTYVFFGNGINVLIVTQVLDYFSIILVRSFDFDRDEFYVMIDDASSNVFCNNRQTTTTEILCEL